MAKIMHGKKISEHFSFRYEVALLLHLSKITSLINIEANYHKKNCIAYSWNKENNNETDIKGSLPYSTAPSIVCLQFTETKTSTSLKTDARCCAVGQDQSNIFFSVAFLFFWKEELHPLILEFETFSCGHFCYQNNNHYNVYNIVKVTFDYTLKEDNSIQSTHDIQFQGNHDNRYYTEAESNARFLGINNKAKG